MKFNHVSNQICRASLKEMGRAVTHDFTETSFHSGDVLSHVNPE